MGGAINPAARRKAAKYLVAAGLAIGAVHVISALTLDRIIQYKEISYASAGISPALDGYRIAFLTDVHSYPEDKLKKLCKNVAAKNVGLVLLGGDFSREGLSDRMELIAGISSADGIYGVGGNHDDPAQLDSEMKRHGAVLLENAGAAVREGLYVAGLSDLWNRTPDAKQALSGAGKDDFVIMLGHNPDIAMDCDIRGADLMLSGHTHGGEITFFGLWGPAMPLVSKYGQRFRSGFCKSAEGTDVYVSRGIGRHAPVRVFARPQVILLTLRSCG